MNTNTLRKILAILLAILFVITLGTTNVWATEGEGTGNEGGTGTETEKKPTFTDFSKATFSLTRDEHKYNLEIKNVTLKTEEVSREYYIFMTNGEQKAPIKFDENGYLVTTGLGPEDYRSFRSNQVDVSTMASVRLAHVGDVYLTILEYDGKYTATDGVTPREKYKIVEGIKLARPKLESLTQRITVFPSSTETVIYDAQNSYYGELKYTVKIGRVTDQQILRDIRDGKSDCLNNLLTYAKNQQPMISKSGLVGSPQKNAGLFQNGQFTHRAYYYGYFAVETENGKYYPLEDVMLFQAVNSTSAHGDFLYNYLDKNFAWDLEEAPEPSKPGNEIVVPPTKNNTVTNSNKPTGITGNMDNTKAGGTIPQTGSMPMITICILAVILLAGGFAYYQNRKYKGI